MDDSLVLPRQSLNPTAAPWTRPRWSWPGRYRKPGGGRILITGCSSGIGRATALELAARGMTVFAGVRRDRDGHDLLRAAPAADRQRLHPMQLDVTIPEGLETVRDRLAATGDLHALVNNAGIGVPGPLAGIDPEEFRRVFDVNLFGTLTMIRLFLPLLLPDGRIINMGSGFGKVAPPYQGSYAASKYALEGLSETLRQELQPGGVQVSLIAPGVVRTPYWEKQERAFRAGAATMNAQQRAAWFDDWERRNQRHLRYAQSRLYPSPERVARVVARALTVRRPAARYPVGPDSRAGALGRRFLPDWLMHRIVAWLY